MASEVSAAPITANSDGAALPAGRWQALAVMAVSVFLSMTTWFSASAVVPQVRAAWHLTTNQASLLTIAVQLGFVGWAVICAALTLPRVLPPKWVFCCAAVGGALGNAARALRHGPGLA